MEQTQEQIARGVQGNVLQVGIPLTLHVVSIQNGVKSETSEDFIPNSSYPVVVLLSKGTSKYPYTPSVVGNVVSFEDDGTLPVGVYQVEVLCRNAAGKPCRYMARGKVVIVDATIDAGLSPGIEFDAQSYTLEGGVFLEARGTGIANITVEESHESGGYNVVTILMTDGEQYTFNVRNGVDGNAVLRHELIEAEDFEAQREAGTLSENTIYLIPEEE